MTQGTRQRSSASAGDAAAQASPSAAAQRPAGAGSPSGALVEFLARYGLVVAVVVLFAAFSIGLPSTFPTWGNVQTMVNSQAVIVLLAIGLTLPMRAGDFDLSIAGTLTCSGAVTAALVTHGQSVPVAIAVALLLGLAVGLLNGLLVVKAGVDAFIVTLGMGTVLAGLAYAITGSEVLTQFPEGLVSLARTEILGLPALTWYGWLLVALVWFVYERTPYGRYLVFLGGSREAARLAGLRVDALRASTFLGSALIAAFAGVMLASSIGSLDPSLSGQFLLQPFAAAFLGAATISVGRFNALGTLVGIYLLVVGITGLQLLGVEPWVSDVFNGGMLVIAVAFATIAAKSRR